VTLNGAEALLVVSIGACTYLAVLQLWLGFRTEGPSRWSGAWAVFAVVFSGARFVQLTTSDPGVAISAARIEIAATPLLMWTLCRLAWCVSDWQPTRFERRLSAGLTGVAVALMLWTPLFIVPEIVPARDLAGDPFLGVRSGPWMAFAGLQTACAVAWCAWKLNTSVELSHHEKQVFGASLSLYAVMGLSSLLRALELTESEGLLEYGPLVMSLGAGRVLAVRQRRLENTLEQQIAARSAELRESETRYREVIEHAPVGFLSLDATGKPEDANAAVCTMLAVTREQFARSDTLLADAGASRSGFTAMLERAWLTGELLTDEFEFDSWSGKRVTTRTSIAPRRGANGAIEGALAIIEDVSDQRAIERKLESAQRMEAIGQLAAGIAHEINNPMAYVRSNLTVLGEDLASLAKEARTRDPASPALARLAELDALRVRSLESVQRAVGIVRDLREFSRSGHAAREAVDLNALLENAARLAATRGDGLREIALLPGEIPPVLGTPDELRQVLLNLLIHAVRAAGPTGRVEASTSRAASEVLVSVRDDGVPIRPDQRARLFEPLSAARGGANEPSLALYISQQIVREHGGRIEVLSNERGTEFIVRLPVAPAEDEAHA
jgi:PAS domain S-box-containing protein